MAILDLRTGTPTAGRHHERFRAIYEPQVPVLRRNLRYCAARVLKLYPYSENNPINYVDPLGLKALAGRPREVDQ